MWAFHFLSHSIDMGVSLSIIILRCVRIEKHIKRERAYIYKPKKHIIKAKKSLRVKQNSILQEDQTPVCLFILLV